MGLPTGATGSSSISGGESSREGDRTISLAGGQLLPTGPAPGTFKSDASAPVSIFLENPVARSH